MYCYKKVEGEVLSNIVDLPIFGKFLAKCQDFWLEKDLNLEEKQQFQDNCLKFYKDKTFERVQLFYKKF